MHALSMGIRVADVVDGGLFIVGMGFVVGHFVHVGIYNPEMIDKYGWVIFLQVWAGFSSNGGFVGAVLGTWLWFTFIRKRTPFWKFADTIAYSLPFGWFLATWRRHTITSVAEVISFSSRFSRDLLWRTPS